jgi:ABC-type sugar transport system permease subunit
MKTITFPPIRRTVPMPLKGAQRSGRPWRERVQPVFWIAPGVLILIYFTYLPILLEICLSFFQADGFKPVTWAGWQNYSEALQDQSFLPALLNNFWYGVLTVCGKISLALVLAVILNQSLRGIGIFRTVFFLPVVLSFVAVGIIWTLIYNYNYGIVNAALDGLRLGEWKQDWLGNPQLAFPCVVLVDLWKWTGFHVVIYLAGLQSIPGELYEAAAIDGAGLWQRFIRITVPLLKPFTAINVLLASLGALSVFDLVYVMTQGGPVKATNVVMIEVYNQAFQFNQFGYAAAMSAILLALIVVISLLVLRLFRDRPATPGADAGLKLRRST